MTLEEQIQAQIATIGPAADLFPGVTIVLNARTAGVEYMSARGLAILGIGLEELRALGPEYHQRYFNQQEAREYVPLLWGLLTRSASDEIVTFFQQVRRSDAHPWAWYLSTARVFLRDAAGQPLLILVFASPVGTVSHLTEKVERILEERTFLRQHEEAFSQLTQREKQVLRLLVLGKSSPEIAAELFIAVSTVVTHRRNINAKLRPQSDHDLTRYAYAFDLV